MGLVGVKCCPAPRGIRKSGVSQMLIHVTAISWWQADLEKTENMLLGAVLAPNNEEFSVLITVSVCLPQVPEFLHVSYDFWFTQGWICSIHVWYRSHRKTQKRSALTLFF